jgi:hypothetical protein
MRVIDRELARVGHQQKSRSTNSQEALPACDEVCSVEFESTNTQIETDPSSFGEGVALDMGRFDNLHTPTDTMIVEERKRVIAIKSLADEVGSDSETTSRTAES